MIMLKSLIKEGYKDEPSELDASIRVMVVRKDDPIYNKVGHHFSKHGDAFLDLHERTIFIDGETADSENWTRDHFLFVQAHEIAHIRLDHDRDNADEAYTDYYAIVFLYKKGFKDAAAIGISQFEYRNGITFEDYVDKINGK